MKRITTIVHFAFALFVLACLALAPRARAVVCYGTCDPDGSNTALGDNALVSNSSGHGNTATGERALRASISGSGNTATGHEALYSNTTASNNTATGERALHSNTTGGNNTATGAGALYGNTTGVGNTANGAFSLNSNTTGNNNTAVGYNALLNNIGNNNIAIGNNAGSTLTTGSNNIDIGAFGAVAGESNTIRIGKGGLQTNAYMQGIRGRTVPSGITVVVGTDGHLGTVASSARFKEEIMPMDKVSEGILALKPVTFRYKKALDPEGILQFGLVAEEVAKVNPDLITSDEQGKPQTVRYEAVNAMLLNEFLKEHRKVEQLEKQVATLTAGLQKVSAQLKLSKSSPQTVLNNQ